MGLSDTKAHRSRRLLRHLRLAAIASYLPARRALDVDPLESLRAE